jgi:GAF domain-containing protein
MLWGLFWSILAVFAVLCVITEIYLKRRKQREQTDQDRQWRQTESQIRDSLDSIDRRSVIADVRGRASENKAALQHICQATATALGAPAAVITVVEIEGQRWLAYYGADWCGEDVQAGVMTPLQTSYCKYVVATDQPLVIADSLTDIRVRTADGETKRNVRAYIGAPVHSAEGIPVGSLCVFDVNPRDWTQRDQSIVSAFASLVVL